MQTLNQYLPQIEERKSKFYMPIRAWLAGVVALLLFALLLGFAFNYPTSKKNEAIETINQFNQKTEETNKKTGDVISRMATLAPSLQDEYSRTNTDQHIQKLRDKLTAITAVKPADIVTAGNESLKKWDDAQSVIQSSPYRDLKFDEIPKTEDGLKLIQAKKTKQPEGRFDYQFLLTDGKTESIKRYKDSVALLIQTQRELYDLDRKINGDKAAPLGKEAQLEDSMKKDSAKDDKRTAEQKFLDMYNSGQNTSVAPTQEQPQQLTPVTTEQSTANMPLPQNQVPQQLDQKITTPEPAQPTNKPLKPMGDKVKLAGWIHNHAGTPHFSPSWDCSSEIPDFMPACEAQAHNLTSAQIKKMGIDLH